jgi:hypothetical protein
MCNSTSPQPGCLPETQLAFALPCSLQFPYYTFIDRSRMYTVGSLFYAIYFFVSFPMFYRIDEDVRGKKWTLSECVIDRWVGVASRINHAKPSGLPLAFLLLPASYMSTCCCPQAANGTCAPRTMMVSSSLPCPAVIPFVSQLGSGHAGHHPA